MTLAQTGIHQHLAYSRRQAQQTQLVGDSRLLLAYARSHSLLRQMELLHQLFVAFGLLQKMQVLTLQVFNQRNLCNLLRSIIADNNRYLRQLSHTGSTQTALAGNQQITSVLRRRYQKRLQHAVLGDGSRQLF